MLSRALTKFGPRGIARAPRRTVRLRLTLLYGTLFLISGAVLLAITYLLVRGSTGGLFFVSGGHATITRRPPAVLQSAPVPPSLRATAAQLYARASRQQMAELNQLLTQSGIALAIMAIASVALGWFVAGRVLRPLRAMTATAERISGRNLHERLAIQGPRDELRDLADTIDGLLARLEDAFGAQRRFVANAAHELRTPLTLVRALLEETLTDEEASIEAFRSMSRRLVAIGDDQERLLDALLTLASSERGIDRRQPFDLAPIADELLLAPRPTADCLKLDIEARIAPAPTVGDPALAKRLVANLIDNAVRHNVPCGRVHVATGAKAGQAFVLVTNTGPPISAEEVERLFEPFQRLADDRTSKDDGHYGLGLSIVRAIATAHNAKITARAGPEGGLDITVTFPLDRFDKHLRPSSANLYGSPQLVS